MAPSLTSPSPSVSSALDSSAEADARGAILRQLVDVFVLKPHHAPAEIARFEEVAGALSEQAPPACFVDLARRLVGHPCAPTELLEKFARMSEDAAEVVLGGARSVSPARLAAAVAWGPARVAAAVASRADLDPTLAAALAMRPERDIGRALAANKAAPLSRLDLRALAARARDDEDFAKALLERLDGEEAMSLFLYADEAQRAGIVAAALRRDLLSPPRWAGRVIEPAELDALVQGAMRSDEERSAQALAAALDLPSALAERILADAGGEPIALALAALALTEETRERLLVFLAPGWGAEFRRFEKLRKLAAMCPPFTARRLLGALVGRSRADAAADRPDAALAARAVAGRSLREGAHPAAEPVVVPAARVANGEG